MSDQERIYAETIIGLLQDIKGGVGLILTSLWLMVGVIMGLGISSLIGWS